MKSVFYLRTLTLTGGCQFNNLYLQDTGSGACDFHKSLHIVHANNLVIGPANVPILTSDPRSAAQAFYDANHYSIRLVHGDCSTSGLIMVQDNDMSGESPVLVAGSEGSARMSIAGGDLTWDNDRFGSWLACDFDSNGTYRLFWWDLIAGQDADSRCMKVTLLTEQVPKS